MQLMVKGRILKIALVQDWFVVNGGAEKIVRALIDLYPTIDVFGLVDFLDDKDRLDILNGKQTKTSFIQHLPFSKRSYRNYLPLFPLAISSLNLSEYDVIISSSYAVAKGVKKRKHQIHICYCHSPIRYAWDLQEEYMQHIGGLKRLLAKLTLSYIRYWDTHSNQGVDVFIANSFNIAGRIARIYKRDALVIYPPVDLSSFAPKINKMPFYFTSARLVAYKKIDLIIATFNELPHLNLVVSGDGPELAHLKMLAKKNITFTGYLEKEKLVEKMQQAKAFILAAEEDFGITSLEAQACNTPVIAYRKGGYLETVIEGKTGVFFDEQTVTSLKKCIIEFEESSPTFQSHDFASHVASFSTERFKAEMHNIVLKYVQKENS